MKHIGKYEICGLLGRGGMGVVYKARLPVVNKIVALKLLAPHANLASLLGREEIERRFAGEAAAMASFRHPNLVDILDYDHTADGRPFFTMEYYYQNLGMIIGEGCRAEDPCRMLSLDKAIRYTRQILSGLSRLHRAGVVHRDIKPYNLLITDEDSLKICDFGLSKLRGEELRNPPNLMVGSPFYAAPEQEKNPEEVDGRADIYSTGVVLYRMLTGHLPGTGDPSPSEVHPDADAAWDDFVFNAIHPNRDRRFAGADAMLRELDAFSESWEKRKKEFCRIAAADPASVLRRKTSDATELRRSPVKTRPGEAFQIFESDALFRPRRYLENDFELAENRKTVLDRATGLLWERRGPSDPLGWREAYEHVQRLNEQGFAGHVKWRLPTVNELFSLLRPYTFGMVDCLEPVFGDGSKWLWSCDRRSFTAAWYVDVELGFACWSDFTCCRHVRAVCGG